jgi:peptidoglycan/xylan/chitin deacetylase (PgdA/CDA1 family)
VGYTPCIEEGTWREPEVVLTFDDGPSSFTPQILTVLQRERVPGAS